MRRWVALLLLAATQAQAAPPQLLHIQVDRDQKLTTEYRLWSNHPYVRLKDTWQLGWAPYLDSVHGLADLAQCVRLEQNSSRVVGVWIWSGARGATLGTELPRMSVPTRTAQNEMWLPLDSVATLMGYKVTFDAKKQLLTLTSYPRADDNTIPGACQAFLRAK